MSSSDDLTEQAVLDAIREAKRQIAEKEEQARVRRRRWAMALVWTIVVVTTATIWLVIDAIGGR